MGAELTALSEEELAGLKVVWIHATVGGITVELTQQILHLLLARRRKAVTSALDRLSGLGMITTRTQNYRQVYIVSEPWQEQVDRFLPGLRHNVDLAIILGSGGDHAKAAQAVQGARDRLAPARQ